MDQARHWMKKALRMAARGRGRVSPNPLVGCLIVHHGEVVGRGYHLYERGHHAEVLALKQAAEKARGADLYVTLEPCSHLGRTPPCTRQIIEAGVARVMVASSDPNPLVNGKGIESLRRAGVEVEVGLCKPEAERLNETFFHYIQSGRPFTLLKLALTLDGKIATSEGHSQWITGEKSRQRVHRLRYEYDSILVGVDTLLRDDPSLTVRWRKHNQITRVILDTHLRTPAQARVFQSSDPVVIFHGGSASQKRQQELGRQADLVKVAGRNSGLDWAMVLEHLGERRLTSLLIEGGSRIAASALKSGVVNKICWFYGPKIVGGPQVPAVGDLGVLSLSQALQVKGLKVRALGSDFMVEGYL